MSSIAVRHIAGPVAAFFVTEAAFEGARAEDAGIEGVDIGAAYTVDVLSNVKGGLRKDIRYLDNADIIVDIDPAAFSAWRGAAIHVYGLYNNGKPFSEDVVGDMQVVSSIEAPAGAFRLYEAWIEQQFADGAFSLLAGLYDLNSEFDSIESAGLFLNSAHGIGSDIGQTGENGPSIFPIAGLALRASAAIADDAVLRVAAIEGTPGDPDRPQRTTIDFSLGEGAFLIAEIEQSFSGGKMLFGAWGYTAEFDSQEVSPIRRRGNIGAYVRGELVLHDSAARTLTGFARAGWANAEFNPIEYFFSAGVNLSSPLGDRPEDAAGFAISWAKTGEEHRAVLNAGGAEAAGAEINLELTYRFALSDRLAVQPDIQYVVNPSSDRSVGDALILGLRVSASM